MAPGSTQSLAEMSTRIFLGDKGRPARKADNLTAICEPIFYKMWEPRRPTSVWASTACYFYFSCKLVYLGKKSSWTMSHVSVEVNNGSSEIF
jgi:hypothetical protein